MLEFAHMLPAPEHLSSTLHCTPFAIRQGTPESHG